MPDITMCLPGSSCGLEQTCRRHTASGTIPSEFRQSWASFKSEGSRCDHYMPVQPVAKTKE